MDFMTILGLAILAVIPIGVLNNVLKTKEEKQKEDERIEDELREIRENEENGKLGFGSKLFLGVLGLIVALLPGGALALALLAGVMILTKIFSNQERIIRNQEEDE